MAGILLVDGVLMPMRKAVLEINFPDPAGTIHDLVSRKPRPVGPWDVTYSLSLDVDEYSGEDGAAKPTIPVIPVYRMLGHHPAPRDLAGLDIGPSTSENDWEAWFGNDAPSLVGNRLHFGQWDSEGLRVTWDARCERNGPLLHEDGPEPGLLRFEGVADFEGIAASVEDPALADAFVRAHWGNAVFASLDRTTSFTPIPPEWAANGIKQTTRVTYQMRPGNAGTTEA